MFFPLQSQSQQFALVRTARRGGQQALQAFFRGGQVVRRHVDADQAAQPGGILRVRTIGIKKKALGQCLAAGLQVEPSHMLAQLQRLWFQVQGLLQDLSGQSRLAGVFPGLALLPHQEGRLGVNLAGFLQQLGGVQGLAGLLGQFGQGK